jgi:hypothetical protein
MKQKAKEMGITYKELKERESQLLGGDPKVAAKKKVKNDNFEIVIKMKDENGEILNFEEEK